MRKAIFLISFIFLLPLYAETTFQKVCIKNICLKTEVAGSPVQRERGLMFRKYLAPDEGMLFILGDESAHSFWMKNMQFSLDIIWIDENKAIVEIMQNVPPCSEVCPDLIPQRKAKFVLEVNAGFSEKNKIAVGDRVEF